jgi:uncharacterized membrane protein YozB (DUF420 family)
MVLGIEVVQINLGLQVGLAFLLLSGIFLKRKGVFFWHGVFMLIATGLNAASFLLVMGPSLLGLGTVIVDYPLNRFSLVTVAHASLGSIAEILAVWIVGSWRLRSETQHCVGKKSFMLVTIVLWLIALFLGVLTYVLKYTSLGAT